MSADRDFAEAIYHEIIAAELVEYALEVWRNSLLLKTWSDADCMKSVLAHVTQAAIETVLARRQRETARTGPWESGHHFQEEDGYPGSLVPPKRGAS